jgi:PleD family two-component response regulator
MTSDQHAEVRDKAFRMGANDFISKPITQEDLAPRVRRFFE